MYLILLPDIIMGKKQWLTVLPAFSVDDVTDGLIQRIIRQKFSSHTIIAVAHKLDTIIDFDKVAVLDNGTLREFGSPHTLLAQPSSAFRQLYDSSVVHGGDD